MLKRNKLQSLPKKILPVQPQTASKETIKETLPKLHFLSKDSKPKNETLCANEDIFLREILEKNRALKEKVLKNGEMVNKLITQIEPKTLANINILKPEQNPTSEQNLAKNEEKPVIKPKNFRIQSAPSEKFIKGLAFYRYEVKQKLNSHRDKSQSTYQCLELEKKQPAKRNADSLHENNEFLATFNPNSTNNLCSYKNQEKRNRKEAKVGENEIDVSNTPSFHTKNSYESSVSTNVDCSFRVKQQKIKDFSFFENNEMGCDDQKRNTGFPKNIFQFINKKQKFFV